MQLFNASRNFHESLQRTSLLKANCKSCRRLQYNRPVIKIRNLETVVIIVAGFIFFITPHLPPCRNFLFWKEGFRARGNVGRLGSRPMSGGRREGFPVTFLWSSSLLSTATAGMALQCDLLVRNVNTPYVVNDSYQPRGDSAPSTPSPSSVCCIVLRQSSPEAWTEPERKRRLNSCLIEFSRLLRMIDQFLSFRTC